MISPAEALASDDLGLVVSPYLAGCNIDVEVGTLKADEVDFDPRDPASVKRETARAKAFLPKTGAHQYYLSHRLSGAGFDCIPAYDRAKFYRDYVRWEEISTWLPAVPHEVMVAIAAGLGELVERLGPGIDGHDMWLQARAALTDEDRSRLRAGLTLPTQALTSTSQGCGCRSELDVRIMHMAVLGGFEDEIAALLSVAPAPTRNAFAAVLALSTVDARLELIRRWGLVPEPQDVQPALVSLGHHAIGMIAHAVKNSDSTADAELIVELVGGIAHSPGIVGFMVDHLATRATRPAREWLATHPTAVIRAELTPAQIQALEPVARDWADLDGLRAATADPRLVAVLDRIRQERALPAFDPATAWWAEATSGLKPLRSAPTLPPLLVDGARLADPELALLCAGLEKQHVALLDAMRARVSPANLDAFAVALVDGWLAEGAPSKQGWRLVSAGLLGGDAFVLHVTPLIREWPGQAQHKRAVNGLTALRNVGSDLALQQIAAIAAKAKFAGIKRAAAQAMTEIAEARGLSREQLEDRIIPDGGLDPRGKRLFSYGQRRFQASLTPESKVVVRLLDPDGRPTGAARTTLPAPNKSDDSELAAQAKAEFALLRKTLTTLAKTQAERFERAMVQARRWAPEDFATFIAPQPLLRGLLAGVVWGCFDGEQLVGLFRIDEDGVPVDVDDEPVELTGSIGVVHALTLTQQQLSQWGQVLADYDLRPPFTQLDRPIARLSEDQGEDLNLHGVPRAWLSAGRLLGVAIRHGWERGAAMDAGATHVFARSDEAAGLTAVISHYPGMWLGGSMAEQEDQRIERVLLLRGVHFGKDLGYVSDRDLKHDGLEQVPWSKAPGTLVSEVCLTLHAMAGEGAG